MNQPKEAQRLIYDGLLEASNYLCKLGSNLITRSTNLKHDKIVSTKLSSRFDIACAVEKIELICELTKRSLDNVENGVRYVLEDYENRLLMHSKKQSDNTKWYTFECDNLVLKISKKINLSQYTSAQVLLKQLNQSIMNKYTSAFNKMYVIKPGQTNISSHDASKKNTKASKSSLGNGKKRRRISSDTIEQNAGQNEKVEITNNSCSNIGMLESEKKINATVTEKLLTAKSKAKSGAKISLDVETSSNEKIETEDKSRRDSKEITALSKDKIVRKRKSISEGQEEKEKETLNDEMKDTNNLMEDNKKKSETLEQEDEETEKSLGKLTCTGGMENIRIKCVDINKLIDKAKALNCQLTFKSNKPKSDVEAKTEIKKKTDLSGINKRTEVNTKSDLNKKPDDDAKGKLRKKSNVVDKSESKKKSNVDAKSESLKKSDVDSKSESRKKSNFDAKNEIKKKINEETSSFIAKPFSIKIIRLHNNLQTFKDDFNIKKIFYKNEEIVNLIEGITDHNDTDTSFKNKNKEQQIVAEDIDASTSSDRNSPKKSEENNQDQITNILSTSPNHLEDVDSVRSSQDFELRYQDSPDEDQIVNEGLACLKEEVELHLEEEERRERQEHAKSMLLKYSDNEEKLPKNDTQVKVSLVNSDNSSSDETVVLSHTNAKTSLRLTPQSPSSKRRLSQSSFSSPSSCSSTENAKFIKKVRFE